MHFEYTDRMAKSFMYAPVFMRGSGATALIANAIEAAMAPAGASGRGGSWLPRHRNGGAVAHRRWKKRRAAGRNRA